MDDAGREVPVVDRRRGQLEVDDDQRLDELRAAGEDHPVGADDHRVAVEDQLVLPADHVEVGQRAPGLGGPAAHQLEPGVVLLPLVGRAVDDEQELGAGVAGLGDRSALLPEVLADGDGHVDPAHPDHGERLAGREDPVLVEDAVVRQVVLGVAAHDAAVVDDRRAVLRQRPPGVGVEGAVVGAVEVADDDRHVTVAVGGEVARPAARRRGGSPRRTTRAARGPRPGMR